MGGVKYGSIRSRKTGHEGAKGSLFTAVLCCRGRQGDQAEVQLVDTMLRCCSASCERGSCLRSSPALTPARTIFFEEMENENDLRKRKMKNKSGFLKLIKDPPPHLSSQDILMKFGKF